jgi:preprotein translocase subunit SecD
MFGTGPIKGIAVTLSIGIVINLFTAVFGSKVIFDWILQKYKPRSLSI